MSDGLLELRAVTLDVGEAPSSSTHLQRRRAHGRVSTRMYLVDGLEVTPGEQVSLETVDSLKPALIRPIGSEDFLYLLGRSGSPERAARGIARRARRAALAEGLPLSTPSWTSSSPRAPVR